MPKPYLRNVRVTAVALLTLLIGSISTDLQAQFLSTVVLKGDPAPGFDSPPGTFFSFNPAVISESGHVVFEAFITTGAGFPSAIYRWDSVNGLKLVAKEGLQSTSNGDFDIFTFGGAEIVDDQGRVAFQASLNDPMEPLAVPAIFFWENDTLTLLVKDGEPETVDGTHPSTGDPIVVAGTFELLTGPWDFAFNGGKVAFNAGLDTDPGLARGLWLAGPSDTCLGANQCTNLANNSQNAPDAPPPPVTPRFTDFLEVVRNPAGTTGALIAFNTGDQQFGFYRWNSSNNHEYVARGNIPFSGGLLQLAMDTVGSIGFRGGFGSAAPFDGDNSKSGVFAGLRQVYQERISPAPGVVANPGDPAPLLGLSTSHAQTNSGTSVFAAKIWQDDGGPPGSLHNMNGLWRETGPGSIELVAHEGQDIMTLGAEHGPSSPTYESLFGAHVNRQGQLALWARKQGTGINPTNDEGLFAIDGDGTYGEVLSKGDVVVLEDLQAKTVTGFFPLGAFSQADTYVNGPGTDGRAHALNSSGDLAMVLDFLDGGSGVFVLPLGELMVIDPPKLVALEVTQVIQDWENSIALTKDKKTIVRAHLESPQNVLIAPILRGRRNSVELPESPLVPANTGLLVATVPDAVAVRGNLARNPYFELPKGWADGTLELELELEGVGIDCQEVAGPIPMDCKTTVSFISVNELEIRFVKIRYPEDGGRISPSNYWLDDMARRVVSAFPISSLDWDIGVIDWTGTVPPQTSDVNDELEIMRAADKCTAAAGCKRLYYGVVLRNGIAGQAYLGGAIGSGWVPRSKLAEGRHTHTHEIGHNLGRPHSTSEAFGTWTDKAGEEYQLGACCSTEEIAYDDYSPMETIPGAGNSTMCSFGATSNHNGRRPTFGEMDMGEDKKVYGFDSLLDRVVDPTEYFDMLSYCSKAGIDLWTGRTTYDLLRTEINARFDPAGAQPAITEGAELDYIAISGEADLATGEVVLDPVTSILGVNSPENPPSGSHTLRLRDGGGGEIQTILFEPIQSEGRGHDPNTLASFVIFIEVNPAIRQIEVENATGVAAMISASANPPTVSVTSPNGGENISTSTVDLTWDGNDVDGDPLTYMVQFSPDTGSSWATLVTDTSEESLTVDRRDLTKTDQGLIRVLVSDGFDTAFDVSDGLFTVENNPPTVAISAPVNNPIFTSGQLITFEGTGIDPEDGLLGGSSLAWSSDIDGALGTGGVLSVAASSLSTGGHTITATATDSDGGQGSSQIQIYIDFEGAIFIDGFESNFGAWSEVRD